jgi:ribosomal protein S6
MTQYELFYLVGESKESQLDRIKAEVMDIVAVEGGTFSEAEKVEKRKLAYPVQKEIRGTYIAKRFTVPGKDDREASVEKGEESHVARITRKLNLYRDVLRFIIVRANELPSLGEEAEGTAKVVEEVAKEEKAQKAEAAKKAVRKPKAVAKEKEEEKEVKAAKKEKEAAKMEEADIDKKLEEVLNL